MRKVRVEAQVILSFDLFVADEAWFDQDKARRSACGQLDDLEDWFDSLEKPTVVGDGNMRLEWDARSPGIDWNPDE